MSGRCKRNDSTDSLDEVLKSHLLKLQNVRGISKSANNTAVDLIASQFKWKVASVVKTYALVKTPK